MQHMYAMRTTITINEELLAEIKRLAAAKQSNVSAIVSDALRAELKRQDRQRDSARFMIPTYGAQTTAQALSPQEIAGFIEDDELSPYSHS